MADALLGLLARFVRGMHWMLVRLMATHVSHMMNGFVREPRVLME